MSRRPNISGALYRMALLFIGAVVLKFAIEYTVNDTRDTSHWVDYEIVRPQLMNPFDDVPTARKYKVGERPMFFTKSSWYRDVVVSWPDVMWCQIREGINIGLIVRYPSIGGDERYPRKSGLTGFYDEQRVLIDGSTSGYWQWSGEIPDVPSLCWLDPNPVLYPSPLVERPVRLPSTATFEFEW